MVKIKFIGDTDFISKGISFIPNYEYEVSEEVAEYLKEHFGNIEVLEDKKVAIQEQKKVVVKTNRA